MLAKGEQPHLSHWCLTLIPNTALIAGVNSVHTLINTRFIRLLHGIHFSLDNGPILDSNTGGGVGGVSGSRGASGGVGRDSEGRRASIMRMATNLVITSRAPPLTENHIATQAVATPNQFASSSGGAHSLVVPPLNIESGTLRNIAQ